MTQLSFKRKIVYIAVPYIVIIGVLLLLEGGIRNKYGRVPKLALFTAGNFERKVEAYVGQSQQVFDGDALLGWKLMDGLDQVHWDFTTFSTNKQGIRYSKDIKPKKDATTRIVSLGDSVTFGYRVPVAFPEDPFGYDSTQLTFTQILERDLRNSNSERDIEVIPMAVPGYTSYQGLLWLRREIEFLDPDLIVVLFGWNDTEMNKKSDVEALPDSWFKFASREILSRSQALIYFSQWLNKEEKTGDEQSQQEPDHLVPRVSRDEYIKNILDIHSLAEENNAEVLVIGTVLRDTETDPFQSNLVVEYRKELAKLSQEKNLHYLEIEELTESNYPENNNLFGELIHPNFLGHQIMADEISKYIGERNILNSLIIEYSDDEEEFLPASK